MSFSSKRLRAFPPQQLVATPLQKDAEKQRIQKELFQLENELKRSKKILCNKKFIEKASKEKVVEEKEKYNKYRKAYQLLKKEK